MTDCHTHTRFSPDSFTDPEEHIKAAIAKGLKHLTVTEHMDFPHSVTHTEPGEETFDCFVTEEYFDGYERLREKYKDIITLTIGIEAGYTKEDVPFILTELKKRPYEYVISSVHIVDGVDVFWKRYYAGKTKKESYGVYLDRVKESLSLPYRVDAVGHLGYVARYSVYENKDMTFEEFPEKIDSILTEMIKKDIFLEMNSKTTDGSLCLPHPSVIKRYYELGGRLLTFGSDSHTIDGIGAKYSECAEFAKFVGFKCLVYKYGGKIMEDKI